MRYPNTDTQIRSAHSMGLHLNSLLASCGPTRNALRPMLELFRDPTVFESESA